MLGINCKCVDIFTDFESVDGKCFDLGLTEHADGQLVGGICHVRVEVSVEVGLSDAHIGVLRVDQFKFVSMDMGGGGN